MRTRAKQKFVAKATALGARVPQAELFILLEDRLNRLESNDRDNFYICRKIKRRIARLREEIKGEGA